MRLIIYYCTVLIASNCKLVWMHSVSVCAIETRRTIQRFLHIKKIHDSFLMDILRVNQNVNIISMYRRKDTQINETQLIRTLRYL